MEGAAERMRHKRALVWWGAMLPQMKKPPEFREFVDPPARRSERQSPEILQAMCDALAAAWGATRH